MGRDYELPVVEQILSEVVATISTISPAQGYSLNINAERPTPRGTNWRDGTAVVYLGARTPTEDGDRPQQYEQWYQTVVVVFHGVETGDQPIDQRLAVAAADIHKALCGTAALRKRDGWAISTVPGDVIPLERDMDSNEGKILLEFTVQYRHNWGDPYTCPFRT